MLCKVIYCSFKVFIQAHFVYNECTLNASTCTHTIKLQIKNNTDTLTRLNIHDIYRKMWYACQ